MLDIYIWNPSASKKQSSNNTKLIAKSAFMGGSIGHMSLAVTIYENQYNISQLPEQYPKLTFEPALPLYEAVKDPMQDEGYKRGKQIAGIMAVNSFWPKIDIGVNWQRVFTKIAPSFTTLNDDMISESTEQAAIRHHQIMKKGVAASEREKKVSSLNKRIEALDERTEALNKEIKKLALEIMTLQKVHPVIKLQLPEDKVPNINYKARFNAEVAKKNQGKELELTLNQADALLRSTNISQVKKNLIVASYQESQGESQFLALLSELRVLANTSVNNLIDQYLRLNKELARVIPNTPEGEAKAAILDYKLAGLRHAIINELKKCPNQEQELYRALYETQANLLEQSKFIGQSLKLIQNVEGKLARFEQIEHEKKLISSQQTKNLSELEALRQEIEQLELTTGKNADITFSLPTKESGKHFYIDETEVLKYMEQQRSNASYQLVGNNCARSVKNCVLAGIVNNAEMCERIANLPGISKDFFKPSFLDTPNKVMKWLFKLNNAINRINEAYENEIKDDSVPKMIPR